MIDDVQVVMHEVITGSLIPDPDSRFTGLPLRVDQADWMDWVLVRKVTYRRSALETITVKEGFRFDFASIPRALWWLYPPMGTKGNPYGVAALIHDWLYCHRKIGGRPVERRECDAVFYEILRYVGCRRTLAWTMWSAVRVGGWLPWMRRKSEDIIP